MTPTCPFKRSQCKQYWNVKIRIFYNWFPSVLWLLLCMTTLDIRDSNVTSLSKYISFIAVLYMSKREQHPNLSMRIFFNTGIRQNVEYTFDLYCVLNYTRIQLINKHLSLLFKLSNSYLILTMQPNLRIQWSGFNKAVLAC